MSRSANGILLKVKQLHSLMHESSNSGFDRLLKKASPILATENQIVYEFKVEKEDVNVGDNLHGGMTASLVDYLTTITNVAIGNGIPGVSVDLSIQYLKAARLGDTIKIETEVAKSGKSLAFLSAKIRNEKGDLVAIGNHIKFVGQ